MEHGCDPIVFLPFLLCAINFLPRSLENMSQNKLGEIGLTLSSCLLSTSSLIAVNQLTVANSIVLASLTWCSLQGNLFSKELRKFSRITNRELFIRFVFVVICSCVIAWVIYYLGDRNFRGLICQYLICSSFIICCIAASFSKDNSNQFGTGSIFLWLSLRLMCTPAVFGFYFWVILALLAFIALNIAHIDGNIGGIMALKKLYDAAGCTTYPSILSLSVMCLIMSCSGVLFTSSGTWNRFTPSDYKSISACSDPERNYISSLDSVRTYTRSRYIYENAGCLVNGMFLVGNACFLYIHDIYQRKISGKMWQSLFFLLVVLSLVYYEKDEKEFILFLHDSLNIDWSRDSQVLFGLCAVGSIMCLGSIERKSREKLNQGAIPVLAGSLVTLLFILLRIGSVFPIHNMLIELPAVASNFSVYSSIVGVTTCWNVTSPILIGAPASTGFDLSSLLFNEVWSLVALLPVTGGLLVMGMFDFGVSDLGLVFLLSLTIMFGMSVVRLYSELQKFPIQGSLYDPFITAVGISLSLTLLLGAAFRLRQMNNDEWIKPPEEPFTWGTLEDFIKDWEKNGPQFESVKSFIEIRIGKKLCHANEILDAESGYWIWRTEIVEKIVVSCSKEEVQSRNSLSESKEVL